MRIALLLFAAMISTCCTGCSGARSPDKINPTELTGMIFRDVSVDGVVRRYAVYVPPDYTAERRWPTIVFLNGSGECGTDGTRQLLVGLAPAALDRPNDWPFLIVFPQKPDKSSAWADHERLVFAALDDVQSHYRVDLARRYLTGLSQGGHGTWEIAAKHPDVFAAIAPVCGWGDVSLAPALIRTPVWAFHGAMDDVVLPDSARELVAAVQKLGGEAKFTLFPDANHNSWDPAYRGDQNLGAWFLKYCRCALTSGARSE